MVVNVPAFISLLKKFPSAKKKFMAGLNMILLVDLVQYVCDMRKNSIASFYTKVNMQLSTYFSHM